MRRSSTNSGPSSWSLGAMISAAIEIVTRSSSGTLEISLSRLRSRAAIASRATECHKPAPCRCETSSACSIASRARVSPAITWAIADTVMIADLNPGLVEGTSGSTAARLTTASCGAPLRMLRSPRMSASRWPQSNSRSAVPCATSCLAASSLPNSASIWACSTRYSPVDADLRPWLVRLKSKARLSDLARHRDGCGLDQVSGREFRSSSPSQRIDGLGRAGPSTANPAGGEIGERRVQPTDALELGQAECLALNGNPLEDVDRSERLPSTELRRERMVAIATSRISGEVADRLDGPAISTASA